MGLLNFLKGNNLNEEERIIKDATSEADRVTMDTEIDDALSNISLNKISDMMDDLKSRTIGKRQLYAQYEEMEEDSLIAGVLDLLCEEATRKDYIRKKKVWAVPKDDSEEAKEAADYINDFLESIKIDDKLYSYCYQFLVYGEVFLKTYYGEFKDENESNKDERLKRHGNTFSIKSPRDMIAVMKYGEVLGFGEIKKKTGAGGKEEDALGYDLQVLPEYIYICNDRRAKREKIYVEKDEDGKKIKQEYETIIGTSYLESARTAWAIMDLIETLLLYIRFVRSSYYRIVSVEVGASGKTETYKTLRKVKRLFSNQDHLDMKSKKYYGYRKAIPHGENVYVATKQGKNDIRVDEVGGNVDIKEIVDYNNFRDKLFAALKVPKAFLGFDDGNLTGLNNQSLTRQDIRFGHTIEFIVDMMIQLVEKICEYNLQVTEHENYSDLYEINMPQVVTAETADRAEDIRSRLDLATILKEFLSQIPGINEKNMIDLIISDILDLAGINPEMGDLYDPEAKPKEDSGGENV